MKNMLNFPQENSFLNLWILLHKLVMKYYVRWLWKNRIDLSIASNTSHISCCKAALIPSFIVTFENFNNCHSTYPYSRIIHIIQRRDIVDSTTNTLLDFQLVYSNNKIDSVSTLNLLFFILQNEFKLIDLVIKRICIHSCLKLAHQFKNSAQF